MLLLLFVFRTRLPRTASGRCSALSGSMFRRCQDPEAARLAPSPRHPAAHSECWGRSHDSAGTDGGIVRSIAAHFLIDLLLLRRHCCVVNASRE